MDISKYFKLKKTQAELDFVNVDPKRDIPLFVDPYALEIKSDEWSTKCADDIRSFFTAVVGSLRTTDRPHAEALMSQLHEAKETFLGFSKGEPQGSGVGDFQAGQLLDKLASSRAVASGVLSDLAEAELFVEGIGRDRISDLTTNIIRGRLIEYTQAQCALHGIPLTKDRSVGPVWDSTNERWTQGYHDLPVAHGKAVILVPKYSVRKKLSLDSQEFYNHHMIEFLKEEYRTPNSGLAYVLKSGRLKVNKKDVKARHPFVKDDLADFVSKHPEVLEKYKDLKGARGPLGPEDLDRDFDERAFAEALIKALKMIAPGPDAANEYHSFMIGVLSFLFFPGLICPIKEHEIHSGRKRIDIRFTNAGDRGFFQSILQSPQTRALSIPVECKNYSREIANPELDQITGRFGHTRGFFGIICCRSIDKKIKFIERCRDTALDSRGYVVPLDDEDIIQMLTAVSNENRKAIDTFLRTRFDALIS
jgi:hypothetical protein